MLLGIRYPDNQESSSFPDAAISKKENPNNQQRLEENIFRWVVTSKQVFTVVEGSDF